MTLKIIKTIRLNVTMNLTSVIENIDFWHKRNSVKFVVVQSCVKILASQPFFEMTLYHL